jgi:hypothetical protein
MSTKTNQPPPEPLDERIEKFRAELDAYIETRVIALKQECPGVPEGILRRLIENRAPGCPCAQATELLKS